MDNNFDEALRYLQEHPMFGGRFREALDIYRVKVNPETNSVDDDERKNTKTRIWLETGELLPEEERSIPGCSPFCHDPSLDCGGDTLEEAVIRLAGLVRKKRS